MTAQPAPDGASVTGSTEAHLCPAADAARLGVPVHRQVVEPFLRLREDAEKAGFHLRILSGFRGFLHQSSIWNRKVGGELPVLDSHAVPLDIRALSRDDLVFAILRWSALPGASRHHWGTDVDVYDENARPKGYDIELIPQEVDAGGMFAPLHEWLDERIAAGQAHGFFRPYDRDRGGVAPERWHLSHAPVASTCEQALTPDLLRATLSASDVALKETILEHLDTIFERFVININRTHT